MNNIHIRLIIFFAASQGCFSSPFLCGMGDRKWGKKIDRRSELEKGNDGICPDCGVKCTSECGFIRHRKYNCKKRKKGRNARRRKVKKRKKSKKQTPPVKLQPAKDYVPLFQRMLLKEITPNLPGRPISTLFGPPSLKKCEDIAVHYKIQKKTVSKRLRIPAEITKKVDEVLRKKNQNNECLPSVDEAAIFCYFIASSKPESKYYKKNRTKKHVVIGPNQ